jgi:hypothetical protein
VFLAATYTLRLSTYFVAAPSSVELPIKLSDASSSVKPVVIHRLGDVGLACENQASQLPDLFLDRSLAGDEGVRLRPPQADSNAQLANQRVLADAARVTRDVNASSAECTARSMGMVVNGSGSVNESSEMPGTSAHPAIVRLSLFWVS